MLDRHPEASRLQAYAVGLVGETESREIENHLEACSVCSHVVASAPPVGVVSGVRRGRRFDSAVVVPVSEDPAKPRPLYDRVKDLLNPRETPRADVPSWTAGLPQALKNHPRYGILDLIGFGGMGKVYKARHLVMDRDVALKVIRGEFLAHPDAVERFCREVRMAARLVHPNIVTAYDAESCDNVHFLVMEYVEGQPLSELTGGRLSVTDACWFAHQAALGLQHAHEQGMMHSDIKPHNLILTPGGQVKILDFGLARFNSEAKSETGTDRPCRKVSLPSAGTILGTPDYMAPEQAVQGSAADIRADIYSLGCTLYHLLAGAPPFPDASTLEAKLEAHRTRTPLSLTLLRSDVPAALARVVDRMLAKNPADRPATPGEAAAALEPFTTPTALIPLAKKAAAPPSSKQSRRVAIAAVAIALLGFAVLTASAVMRGATARGERAIGADKREGAAEKEDADALFNPGANYVNDSGVAKDDKEEVRWYRMDAEKGDAVAMYKLGWMYANGRGVAKDKKAAVRWYKRAAKLGHKDAQAAVKRLCR